MSRIYQNFNGLFFPGFAKLLQFFSSLFMLKVLALNFSPEEIALWSSALSGIAFFGLIFIGPIGTYINRNLINWTNEFSLIKILFYHFCYLCLITLISVAFFYFFNNNLEDNSSNLFFFLYIIPLILLFQVIFITYHSFLNLFGRNKEYLSISFVISVLLILLPFLFITLMGNKLIFWGLGFLFSNIIAASMSLYYLNDFIKFSITNPKLKFDKNFLDKSKVFIIPSLIFALLSWVNIHGYKFGLIYSGFSIEVISYLIVGLTLSHSLFSALEQILYAVYGSVYQRRVSLNKVNSDEYWADLMNGVIPILVVGFLGYISFIDYLPMILLSESYLSLNRILLIGGIIEVARILLNLIFLRNQGINKTKNMINPFLISYLVFCSIFTFVFFLFDFSLLIFSLIMAFISFGTFVQLLNQLSLKVINKIYVNLKNLLLKLILISFLIFTSKELLIFFEINKLVIIIFLLISWILFSFNIILNDKNLDILSTPFKPD